MIRAVCVFAGSRVGAHDAHRSAAHELGHELATRGYTMIYGGGDIGLMGVAANAALHAGGRVIGVIPRGLFDREIAHDGVSELRVVASMHERKALMHELSDAFVALPGGLGTFDELIETMTWRQLSLHEKPVALLDVDGFWDPFHALLDRAVLDGYLPRDRIDHLHSHPTVPAVLDAIARGAATAP